MRDLFEGEMNDKAEIERLSRIIEELRRSGVKLRNELRDFIEVAKEDNENDTVFPSAQEAINDWNQLIKDSDLAWKEDILNAPSDATLKFLD